jgi:hypothetical protein
LDYVNTMSLDPFEKLRIDAFHVNDMYLAFDEQFGDVKSDDDLGLGDERAETPLDGGWAQGPRVVHEGQCAESSQVRHTLEKDMLGGEVEHGRVCVGAGDELQTLEVLLSQQGVA